MSSPYRTAAPPEPSEPVVAANAPEPVFTPPVLNWASEARDGVSYVIAPWPGVLVAALIALGAVVVAALVIFRPMPPPTAAPVHVQYP